MRSGDRRPQIRSCPGRPLLLLAPVLAAWPALAGSIPAAADAAPVDTKRFPRLVHLLLLPEEESLLDGLRDDGDRRIFQAIFWARRDPTPGTAANEFEDAVRAIWSQSDELYSSPTRKGSETGCGQVLALLGRPEEILGKSAGSATSPGRYDNLAYVREGAAREPETWVYRERPGRPFRFTAAELRLSFDSDCRFAEGGIVKEDLGRAAAVLVTRPELGYRRGSDGHLVPLQAALAATAASAGAAALFASPRTDFPLAAETKLVMRGPGGEAYVAGLLRAAAGASGGPVPLSIAVQARDAAGSVVASAAREVTATPSSDGALVGTWGLTLGPGRYTLALAALAGPGRGSLASIEVLVPDLGGAALAASPLVVYADAPATPGAPDPRDPWSALQLGPNRIAARLGNVFAPQDALMVLATIHGAKPDPATGQAGLRARYSILKDGKSVARGAEDAFTAPEAVASVGPIPLAGFTPGAYIVRLDVTDTVAKQTLRQEAAIEVRGAAAP